MPYPFAHPAAIVPLVGPMGRFAVPSALAIGSMIPDAWYFVPLLARNDSHSLGGLVWFCLPAGLLAYLLFHLVLKQPLLALLPEGLAGKLAPFASPRLPEAAWHAVALSLVVGACTHLAWDALAHTSRLLQHASTLLGTACLAWWIRCRLRGVPVRPLPPALALAPLARCSALALLFALSIGWAGYVAGAEANLQLEDAAALRRAVRIAGLAGLHALCLSTIGYAILWKVLGRSNGLQRSERRERGL
jgi:hypothetical protein